MIELHHSNIDSEMTFRGMSPLKYIHHELDTFWKSHIHPSATVNTYQHTNYVFIHSLKQIVKKSYFCFDLSQNV